MSYGNNRNNEAYTTSSRRAILSYNTQRDTGGSCNKPLAAISWLALSGWQPGQPCSLEHQQRRSCPIAASHGNLASMARRERKLLSVWRNISPRKSSVNRRSEEASAAKAQCRESRALSCVSRINQLAMAGWLAEIAAGYLLFYYYVACEIQ